MLTTGRFQRPRRIEDLLDPALMGRLDRLDIRSRRMFPGKMQGERRSKKRGQSVEFDDYRNYVAGDDLRFIDWNAYARLDRLFIKLFLEEEDLALHLVLDASASMNTGEPNKLLLASRLAAALGYVGLVNHNRVGATVFGAPGMDRPARLADTRGRHRVSRLVEFLLKQVWEREATTGPAGEKGGFGPTMDRIVRERAGAGVMVVLSDFLVPEGYEDGLRALAATRGYDTFCLQILSPGEIEPEVELERGLGGDLRLTDIETGRAAEVSVGPELIRSYKTRLGTFCSGLRQFCVARGMTHLLVRSDTELEIALLRSFRSVGLVG